MPWSYTDQLFFSAFFFFSFCHVLSVPAKNEINPILCGPPILYSMLVVTIQLLIFSMIKSKELFKAENILYAQQYRKLF